MSGPFVFGRVLLGSCFLLDAAWNVASYDVRLAYLDAAGAPHALVWLTVAVYAAGGLGVAAGRSVRLASEALGLVLLLVSVVLLTDLDAGGIGEYPAELHREVLFKEWLVHLGIVGSLLLVVGAPAPAPSGAERDPIPAARVAGRLLVGGYFVVNALWQWAYFDIRAEHIVASGGNPAALPIVIAIQLVGGALVAAGVALRITTVPLMAIVVASTLVVHGNLSETAPYPPNVQVHQWFVKASILAGLIMLLGWPARRGPSRASSAVDSGATAL